MEVWLFFIDYICLPIMIPKCFIWKCQAGYHVHISRGGGGEYTTPQPLVTEYDQIMISKCFIWKGQAEDHAHISRGIIHHSPTLSDRLWSDYDQIMIPIYFIPRCQAEDHVHISRGVLHHSPTLSDRLWSDYDPQIFHTKVSGRGSCSY